MILRGERDRPNADGREVLAQREHDERSLVRQGGDPSPVHPPGLRRGEATRDGLEFLHHVHASPHGFLHVEGGVGVRPLFAHARHERGALLDRRERAGDHLDDPLERARIKLLVQDRLANRLLARERVENGDDRGVHLRVVPIVIRRVSVADGVPGSVLQVQSRRLLLLRLRVGLRRDDRLDGLRRPLVIALDVPLAGAVLPFGFTPGFTRDPIRTDTTAVIVGGGFAGMLTAIELTRHGIREFVIVEKAGDFGGTWYWNRYQSCM